MHQHNIIRSLDQQLTTTAASTFNVLSAASRWRCFDGYVWRIQSVLFQYPENTNMAFCDRYFVIVEPPAKSLPIPISCGAYNNVHHEHSRQQCTPNIVALFSIKMMILTFATEA